MFARIYVPAKNAAQSGRSGKEVWVLEYEPEARTKREPLMGWTGSGDMRSQLKIRFDSSDEAVAYAKRNGIPFQLVGAPARPRIHKRTYAENFSFYRKKGWTH